MANLQGTVVDPSAGGSFDSNTATVNLGRANELIIAELHGKYLEEAYRGNVFYASTATAGVVLPIFVATTLTPTYSIWNPAGSGKLLVPIVTLMGWTATTAALGTFVWVATTNAGSSVAAVGPPTAPIVAFGTLTAPVNAYLGSGKVSQMRFSAAGTTTLQTGQPTFYRGTGITTMVTAAGATTAPWWTARDDWDGAGIIPPGNAIHLMGSTATLAAVTVTLVYAELPL